MENSLEDIKQVIWKEISYDLLMGAYQNILKTQKYATTLVKDMGRSEELVERLGIIEKQINKIILEVENEK